jgi:hypothetical protein
VSHLSLFHLLLYVLILEFYHLQLSSFPLINPTPVLTNFPTSIFHYPLLMPAVKLLRLGPSHTQRNHLLPNPCPLSVSYPPSSINTPYRSRFIIRSRDRLPRCPVNLSLTSNIRPTHFARHGYCVHIRSHLVCIASVQCSGRSERRGEVADVYTINDKTCIVL